MVLECVPNKDSPKKVLSVIEIEVRRVATCLICVTEKIPQGSSAVSDCFSRLS